MHSDYQLFILFATGNLLQYPNLSSFAFYEARLNIKRVRLNTAYSIQSKQNKKLIIIHK